MARYRQALADGALKPDPAQQAAAEKLDALARPLAKYRPGRFLFSAKKRGRRAGLYIWGDVGRGKSMLMDLFFEDAADRAEAPGAFQRLHGGCACPHSCRTRSKPDISDPIPAGGPRPGGGGAAAVL